VVVHNFDIRWTWRTVLPFKANSPLIVNADAELPLSVSTQDLKAVTGQSREIAYRRCRFQAIHFQPRGAVDAKESFDAFSLGKGPRPLVAVASDHEAQDDSLYALRQA
jgi:hypothetical protein